MHTLMRRITLAVVALVVTAAAVFFLLWPRDTNVPPLPDRPSVKGTLVLSHYGSPDSVHAPTRHRTVFVAGPAYSGMEDNDIRGHLDGTFKWGWNQPTQQHVRVGRRANEPKYGEHELFRVLYRWSQLVLPPAAHVTDARLTLTVEFGPRLPVRLLLYRVRKDWNPGTGGTKMNNTSPPKLSEVWWNDVAYGQRAWGLPGVGFAADDHPDADTEAMPVAETVYRPGDATVTFGSPELTRCVHEQMQAGTPVLLLLKLSDYQEDFPGLQLGLFSASYGDSRHMAPRPRLELEWESAAERVSERIPLFLESGRTYLLPQKSVAGYPWHTAEFVEEAGHGRPTLQVRGGRGSAVSEWQTVSLPWEAAWDWLETRVIAAQEPVALGTAFTAELFDTWVRTGAPESQVVPWTFVSPTGIHHKHRARYVGQYRWTIEFVPDEVGPWSYYWTQRFAKTPFRSADGSFDVVVLEAQHLSEQLERFIERLAANTGRFAGGSLQRHMLQFTRLERAALQLQSPESFRAAPGERLRTQLNRARALLGEEAPASHSIRP